jgi:hypothetical protein
MASVPPGLGAWPHQIELEHQPVAQPAQRPWIALIANSPGYFETIHLSLLRGRDFTKDDGAPSHETAILTRDATGHFWPGQDPIGKRFRVYDEKGQAGNWITVIGVSAGITQEVITNDAKPLVFVPYREEGWGNMALVVESSTDPVSAVRSAVQGLDQDLPLTDIFRLDQAVEHEIWFLRLIGELFVGFAFIALIMASVGIYAVMAHAAAGRTREIGVRMALGATTRNVLTLVMSRGLWQVAAGVGLGLAAGIPIVRVMASLPIGVSPSDPTVFFAVASVLASVGIFACWLPARRAAALDPVKAIRCE